MISILNANDVFIYCTSYVTFGKNKVTMNIISFKNMPFYVRYIMYSTDFVLYLFNLKNFQ